MDANTPPQQSCTVLGKPLNFNITFLTLQFFRTCFGFLIFNLFCDIVFYSMLHHNYVSSEFCTLDHYWNVMKGVLSLNHPISLEVDQLAMYEGVLISP
jgi:hypothetical protein